MPLLRARRGDRSRVDIFDREAVFIDRVLTRRRASFRGFTIVFEHVTTARGGRRSCTTTVRASPRRSRRITCEINRNAIFQGGIRPHLYCLPIAKRERAPPGAASRAAISGSGKFFLGTDTRAASRRTPRRPPAAAPASSTRPSRWKSTPRCSTRRGARQARGLRLAERSALLRPAAQRALASRWCARIARRPRRPGRGADQVGAVPCRPPAALHPPDMRIRPATTADCRAIAEVHVASWQQTYDGPPPKAVIERQSVDDREVLPRRTPERDPRRRTVRRRAGWCGRRLRRKRTAPRRRPQGRRRDLRALPRARISGAGRARPVQGGGATPARARARSAAAWVLRENEPARASTSASAAVPPASGA